MNNMSHHPVSRKQHALNIVLGEREYQDTLRKQVEGETRNDADKSVADFILYIENKLNEAKSNIYKLNEYEAMGSVRKIAALSLAAIEAFPTPARTNG